MKAEITGVLKGKFVEPVTGVEAWRLLTGTTQTQLGNILGVGQSHVARIIECRHMSTTVVKDVVKLTGLSYEDVIEGRRDTEWTFLFGDLNQAKEVTREVLG